MTPTRITTPTRMIGSGGAGEAGDGVKPCPGGCGNTIANCTCGK